METRRILLNNEYTVVLLTSLVVSSKLLALLALPCGCRASPTAGSAALSVTPLLSGSKEASMERNHARVVLVVYVPY